MNKSAILPQQSAASLVSSIVMLSWVPKTAWHAIYLIEATMKLVPNSLEGNNGRRRSPPAAAKVVVASKATTEKER